MIKNAVAFVLLIALAALSAGPARADDLTSWNDGAARDAIVSFVETVTDESSPDFVDIADRIAVFDNDGTLWAEQPVYFQLLFALDRAKELAAADPDFASTPALTAAAAGDLQGLLAGGNDALIEVVSATHAGMTVEAFQDEVREWLDTASHPTTGMHYDEMIYQPMLELLDYLRANDFDVYIVSGGGLDFIRAFAEEAYGVPNQNVIGSMGNAKFEIVDGVPQVIKDPGILFIDDKEGKPLAITRHIGKRPILVGGNSDGDLAMAQWSAAGPGERLVLFVHHTDAEREFAYDRDSHIGRFDKALDIATDQGWTVIDMASDWTQIWPRRP